MVNIILVVVDILEMNRKDVCHEKNFSAYVFTGQLEYSFYPKYLSEAVYNKSTVLCKCSLTPGLGFYNLGKY